MLVWKFTNRTTWYRGGHETSNGVDSYSANSDFIRNKYSDKYSRGICCLVSKALNFFSQRLMYSYALVQNVKAVGIHPLLFILLLKRIKFLSSLF